MIRNLFRVAIRRIRKELGYSLIIVTGLTIGIVSSLFLLLYVFDDLSYDRFHVNKDRIVRVVSDIKETDDAFVWAVAQIPFAHQVKEDYPEVESVCRIFPGGRTLYKYNEISRYEDEVYIADSTISASSALPFSVVIRTRCSPGLIPWLLASHLPGAILAVMTRWEKH